MTLFSLRNDDTVTPETAIYTSTATKRECSSVSTIDKRNDTRKRVLTFLTALHIKNYDISMLP